MSVNRCPFCEQMSPAHAKFCSACGGALHLAPCPRCGAVNDVTATACYQCHGQFPGRGTGEADPALPAADAPQPSPGRRPAATIAAAAFAAIVGLGYYGYRQSSLVDVPHPAAASSGGPADAAPAKSDETAQPASPAAAPPETPLADRAPAVETESRADREPEESRPANAAAGLVARPRASAAGKARKQEQLRQEVCTQSVEALGLCTMTPEDRKLAEAAAALKAAIASPEVGESGKAAQQDPRRQEDCTEAVEALGLCTSGATQGRK